MIGARTTTLLAVVLGGAAVVIATLVGIDGVVIDRLVHPPALVRASLVGGSAVLAVTLLARGLARLAGGTTDVPGMVRGVRLAFLALASVSAGAGWAIGDPLPIVIALIIAGVDVVETSLLLLVVGARR